VENITPINVNPNPFACANIGKNGAIIEIEQQTKKLQILKEWNSSFGLNCIKYYIYCNSNLVFLIYF